MSDIDIFIDGWKAGAIRLIDTIEEYSSTWLPNGPSKITAEAILKKMKSVPIPRSENEPVSNPTTYNRRDQTTKCRDQTTKEPGTQSSMAN